MGQKQQSLSAAFHPELGDELVFANITSLANATGFPILQLPPYRDQPEKVEWGRSSGQGGTICE